LSRKLNISQWNERKNILPFEDGIVNIATGSFETHCPENRLTWSLPRSYNNSNVVADWNAIRTWLAEISEGNENNFKSLTHFAAAVLRGRHDLQKVLYLWGDGGSGKGTYTRLLEAILGEINCWSGKIEWLDDPNQVARLLNKKLAIFADQDKVSGKLQSFKNLTGGDKLVGKHLYKDPFEFYFTGLGLITANFAALQGGGIGRWFERRIIAVKMNLAPERVRNLDAEFAPEIAAFTRYLLSISDEEINAVLRDENSTKHTDPNFWEMATRQDSLASWVEQHIIFDSNVRTRVGSNKNEYLYLGDNYNPEFATLFGSYHRYCHQGGLQGKGINNFSPDLEEILRKVLRHPEVERVKTREGSFFIGIRLRAANDDIPIISEAILRRDDHRDDPVTTAVTTSNPCGDRGDDSFHEKKVENSQSKREEENIPNGNGATNSEKVLPPLVTARVSSHHSHHNAEKSTPNEKISVSEFSLNMEVEVVDPELRDFYQQKGTITQILEDSRLLICFPASDTDPERASIFLPSEIRIVRHTSDNEQLDGF
jgi:putative DNA primase/helicase